MQKDILYKGQIPPRRYSHAVIAPQHLDGNEGTPAPGKYAKKQEQKNSQQEVRDSAQKGCDPGDQRFIPLVPVDRQNCSDHDPHQEGQQQARTHGKTRPRQPSSYNLHYRNSGREQGLSEIQADCPAQILQVLCHQGLIQIHVKQERRSCLRILIGHAILYHLILNIAIHRIGRHQTN